MLPIAAALLGGATAAAGIFSYRKIKESSGALRVVLADFREVAGTAYAGAQEAVRGLPETGFGQAVGRQGQKISAALGVVRDETQFVVVAVVDEAKSTFKHLNESEIIPLRKTAAEEWRAFTDVVKEDESVLVDGVQLAREAIEVAAAEVVILGKKAFERSPIQGWSPSTPPSMRTVSLRPRDVWRSLKQAKDLVFDESRDHQFEVMSAPEDGAARSQIAQAEQAVEHYLKVAATAVVVATAGTLFFAPLKIVSGCLILYAATPVFKGAYTDIFVHRRVSVRLLDSVSFIGLLGGGYFLICSITSTIFHASTKMMLKTEDRSRQILANMFGKQPRSVHILSDGEEIEIPFELLRVGDTLVVHAGQMIPIDGMISKGTAAIDQHILTGEAQPAEKGLGDPVFAATMMLAGRIEVYVEKTGAETAAAQIREVLANATDFRTAIQARWKDVADRTVLPTLGLSALAAATLGPTAALAAINSNYVAVMKVASPLGMLNFLQRASQFGVLIKDGRALEGASSVDTVIFDKTGTLTEAEPHLGGIYPFGDVTENELLTIAAAVEANQSHPIAQAILKAAASQNLVLPPLEDARYEVGYGIEARIAGRLVRVGSARYLGMLGIGVPGDFHATREKMQARGASVVYVAIEDKAAGALALHPTPRPEAKEVVEKLKKLGLTLYIISGDQSAPTAALAAELGIDNYFAEVLPQDKSLQVERLQKEGRKVCFVGDGINDAIALKKANVSISLRGASSLATNTAQIILMDESLRQLPQLFEVAYEYDANLKTLMATTFIPGLVSLGGVFFLGATSAAALLLFNLSLVGGLVNAIWPALQNRAETEVIESTVGTGHATADTERN